MSQQAENPTSGVTSAAERKRRQRACDREMLFERPDWRLFLDPATLSQKAGCHPDKLCKVVLKELVDNQLDATGEATLKWDEEEKEWRIWGAGDGPPLSEIPKLFSVNRPLRSSKLKRMVTRGMLGNGLRVVMGAVHALGGSISVSLRGHRLTLAVDPADGTTKIVEDEESRWLRGVGMAVRIKLGNDSGPEDGMYARDAIDAASKGKLYSGPSSPWWYGARDFEMLLHAAPANATVGEVLADLGLDYKDERQAKTLASEHCKTVLAWLRAAHKRVPPEKLGRLGEDAYGYDGYGWKLGTMTTPSGAIIPYVIEAWGSAKPAEKKGVGEANVLLFVNATRAIAPLRGWATAGGIRLYGCGVDRKIEVKTAQYRTLVSIVMPYVQLAGDGKEPVLKPLGDEIEAALKRACNAAYRAMEKPPGSMKIKDVAWQVMAEAYGLASGDREYPANARQIMYAARLKILELTGRETLDDQYFTQTLPDFLNANPELTADWNVVYDARGHSIEPHTGREIGLGTLEVRGYVAGKVKIGPAVSLGADRMYPTHGPLHRYSTILFIEKEGFMPLLEAAQIAERFDVMIMSTKGMSVTAARELLDKLTQDGNVKQVLVMHDFDVSGFSIFGTLFTSNRRYTFENEVPVIDIGLRLEDVQDLELEGEPYEDEDFETRKETLETHGATEEEIEFLEGERVELNAMTAPQFVEFLEGKLEEYADKVVPDKAVIEEHARRIWEQREAQKRCKEILEEIHAEAERAALPDDLVDQVEELLVEEPELSWDQAVAKIFNRPSG
jgi:hypothetical protein